MTQCWQEPWYVVRVGNGEDGVAVRLVSRNFRPHALKLGYKHLYREDASYEKMVFIFSTNRRVCAGRSGVFTRSRLQPNIGEG